MYLVLGYPEEDRGDGKGAKILKVCSEMREAQELLEELPAGVKRVEVYKNPAPTWMETESLLQQRREREERLAKKVAEAAKKKAGRKRAKKAAKVKTLEVQDSVELSDGV